MFQDHAAAVDKRLACLLIVKEATENIAWHFEATVKLYITRKLLSCRFCFCLFLTLLYPVAVKPLQEDIDDYS